MKVTVRDVQLFAFSIAKRICETPQIQLKYNIARCNELYPCARHFGAWTGVHLSRKDWKDHAIARASAKHEQSARVERYSHSETVSERSTYWNSWPVRIKANSKETIFRPTARPIVIASKPCKPSTRQTIYESLSMWIETIPKQACGEQNSIAIDVAPNINIAAILSSPSEGTGFSLKVQFGDPTRGNCLNSEMLTNLAYCFQLIAKREDVNGVLLVGKGTMTGRSFCSGADFEEMLTLKGQPEAEDFIRRVSTLCTAIRTVSGPVIAATTGNCIGAGLEVAASCDMRLCTSNPETFFGMPEVKLGIPSVVEARLLCDIIGWARARHLMLTGEMLPASEAHFYGLVTKMFPSPGQMISWAEDYLKQCAEYSDAPKVQKRLMKEWEHLSLEDGIEAGVDTFANQFADGVRDKTIETMARYKVRVKQQKEDRLQRRAGGKDTCDLNGECDGTVENREYLKYD